MRTDTLRRFVRSTTTASCLLAAACAGAREGATSTESARTPEPVESTPVAYPAADADRPPVAPERAVEPAVPVAPPVTSGAVDPPAALDGEPSMPWQRSLDDALALVAATGKPLLVCVNMDGEPASEALARGRYRDPEFIALASRFVPVLASPDRHEALERDDRGRRIPDRRFGRLLDREHMEIEPSVYERYFSGRRVAPRHVGVSAEGDVLFDLYLLRDLAQIDEALREHGVDRPTPPDPATRTTDELLASRDAADREELERRFVAAEENQRVLLAARALDARRATPQPELIHLALRDPSRNVRLEAVKAIVANIETAPLDALAPAFAECAADRALRSGLVAAARRLTSATGDQTARFFTDVFAELDATSQVVERERWRAALQRWRGEPEREPSVDELEHLTELLDQLERRVAEAPDLQEGWFQLASTRLRMARIELGRGGDPSLLLEDAREAARRALEFAPTDPTMLGTFTWASYMLSDTDAALQMATRSLPYMLDACGTSLTADVLRAFANLRRDELYAALRDGVEWPSGAVSDARSAYEVLLAHAAGSADDARAFLDFLGTLAAFREQALELRRALARWPDSGPLHEYLRFQVLRDAGSRALEEAYEAEPLGSERQRVGPALDWFHGLATFVAAEHDVQCHDAPSALAAYSRSLERFQRSVDAEPSFAESAAHYRALALAASARLLVSAGRLEQAVDAILASVGAAGASFESPDGLGISPAQSARELRRALEAAGEPAHESLRRLEDGLASAGLEATAAEPQRRTR